MANTCKTCKRPDVAEINQALVNEVSIRNIIKTWPGLNIGAVHRHKSCIDALFTEVRDTRRAGLLASVDEVKQEIIEVKSSFVDNPNVRVGLIGKMLDAIEKEAKLTGAYIKDAANPATTKQIAEDIAQQLIAKGWDPGEARDVALREAGKIPEVSQAVN